MARLSQNLLDEIRDVAKYYEDFEKGRIGKLASAGTISDNIGDIFQDTPEMFISLDAASIKALGVSWSPINECSR